MKILALPPFFRRPALAILCATVGLLAGAPQVATAAETFAFPARDPLVQGKLPAGWTVRTAADNSLVLTPPNATDSNVYLDVDRTAVADPKTAMEKYARVVAEAAYTGIYSVQVQDGGASKTGSGVALYSVTLRGKDGWGDDCVVTSTRVTMPGGKSLVLTFSGSPATAHAHAPEMTALIESLKPSR